MLLVADWMTPSPQTIDLYDTLQSALSLMQKNHFRHLPVLANGVAMGVLSERDIQLILGLKQLDLGKLLVKAAYSPIPYMAGPKTHVATVAEVMAKEKYGSVLVLEKKKLVGIFTTTDALRALAHFAK